MFFSAGLVRSLRKSESYYYDEKLYKHLLFFMFLNFDYGDLCYKVRHHEIVQENQL